MKRHAGQIRVSACGRNRTVGCGVGGSEKRTLAASTLRLLSTHSRRCLDTSLVSGYRRPLVESSHLIGRQRQVAGSDVLFEVIERRGAGDEDRGGRSL